MINVQNICIPDKKCGVAGEYKATSGGAKVKDKTFLTPKDGKCFKNPIKPKFL